MAELAVQVPEDHRAGFGRVAVDPDLVDPRLQLLVERASRGQAGHVALHVGHEHRYADAREAFGDGRQGDRLAGARGTGDQPVAIAEFRLQEDPALAGRQRRGRGDGLADENGVHRVASAGDARASSARTRLPSSAPRRYPARCLSPKTSLLMHALFLTLSRCAAFAATVHPSPLTFPSAPLSWPPGPRLPPLFPRPCCHSTPPPCPGATPPPRRRSTSAWPPPNSATARRW